MCGVFTYYGPKTNAGEIVIQGLKRLEYRGYDSWGIAYKNNDKINIYKQVGKIGEINSDDLDLKPSQVAIGHSRWATHGGVTQINAHPHSTENNEIVLIHNGIFENYLELKKQLEAKGHIIKSETDTEIFAHLVQEHNQTQDFEDSVKLALKEVEGRYAVVLMHEKDNKVIAARKGSPLIVGVGENNEYFIASDIPAFLPYTNKVIYLDDNQMVIIDNGDLKVLNTETHEEVEKRIIEIDWDIESAEKGDFPHFMIKEIMEQKDTLSRAINQDPKTIEAVAHEIKNAFGTYLVACGTAGKVCMVGEYLFSKIAKKHVNFSFGSEFPYHKHFLTDKTLMICISQSGETADTLEAIDVAKKKNVKVVAIVNVESSTMARTADIVIPIKAGPEKAVASTKATTAQMAILTLLAYACNGGVKHGQQLLIETAGKINDMLNPRYEEHIMQLAKKIKDVESMYIIGRGMNYPIALESAIKLQEVSYIHAEGFAGGELKHGPIALITDGTPVIAFVPNDDTKSDMISNATEVKARGGYIIGVSPENHPVFDYWIKVPDCKDASPIVNIIPIQILSYQLAVLRQNNPDMPRNLAKSVTVK
ncbi:glutamine--fructose-6-phosphate transaminase (isomerizing) [Candidatus Peregrinibacteria bacterium HGW-Peregrinibacteria-1]|jgi:glucosamine--fructose-6-phosphate aminotransferase (isomerizing)|nr:MAG: glutamine--fructose-6-phosphate transaminase (isomerizing) [Candidatus Peregrinibacteria bacterium HGW-Peregrinibacteria-1]